MGLLADIQRRAALVSFEPGPHRYTVNGAVKPSVTQLIGDIGFMDLRFMQDRTERGRYVHEQTLHFEDGILDLDSVQPEYRGYVESYARWFDMVRPTVVLREQIVYCPTLDVTGAFDRLFLIAGALVLMDLKAGVAQPWHKVQTAGYVRLARSDGYADVAIHRAGLLLKKNGSPAKRDDHTDDHDDSAAFAAAVTRHHWRDRHVPR